MERLIPDPGHAGDTGAAEPAVTEVLAAYAQGRTSHGEGLLVLQDSRLLVPVVAVLGEVEYDDRGLAHDKTSDMAAVLVRGADSRLALLAFTSIETLALWDPAARPVPVAARIAAQAAVQDEAAAVVVDIAGPSTLVVEGEALTALAAGWRLTRMGARTAWIGPRPL